MPFCGRIFKKDSSLFQLHLLHYYTNGRKAGGAWAPGAGGRGGAGRPQILPGGCGQRPAASSTIAWPSFVEVLKAASYTRARAPARQLPPDPARGGVRLGCVLNTSTALGSGFLR